VAPVDGLFDLSTKPDHSNLTPEEAAEFWREHEPHILPPDDEP